MYMNMLLRCWDDSFIACLKHSDLQQLARPPPSPPLPTPPPLAPPPPLQTHVVKDLENLCINLFDITAQIGVPLVFLFFFEYL